MVRKCLFEADLMDQTSIGFPLFGTGGLRYPQRETGAAMLEAIYEYSLQAIESGIHKVTIVAPPEDIKVSFVMILC